MLVFDDEFIADYPWEYSSLRDIRIYCPEDACFGNMFYVQVHTSGHHVTIVPDQKIFEALWLRDVGFL